jgi:hypothetical protein
MRCSYCHGELDVECPDSVVENVIVCRREQYQETVPWKRIEGTLEYTQYEFISFGGVS